MSGLPRPRGRTRTPDEELLHAAARRMAWQIATATAVVVVVSAVIALLIGTGVHHHGSPLPHEIDPDHDDDLIRTTLLIAGAVGIVIAGLVGFVVARRAVAPLGDALEKQRRFVADAGHELRTPLTVLHTRAQLITRRMDHDDPARPLMDQLLDDSRVLGQIVDDLLTSAQLGQDRTWAEPIDLTGIADEATQSMRILSDQRSIQLTTRHSDPRATVLGSPPALRRAVTALIDNALGHTPEHGHVTVSTATDGGFVALAVTDDGEGIGDQDQDTLMARFARGATGEAAGRRFGLGLALVQEIARSHHGTLALANAPGGGAVATLTLPQADPG